MAVAGWLWLLSFWVASARASDAPAPAGAEECLACHSDRSVAPNPRLDTLALSPHAELGCQACHPETGTSPHPAGMKPVDCGGCHEAQAELFKASVHGQAAARGIRAAPACPDCHGGHDVRPPAEPASHVSRGSRAKACADCHQSARLASRFGLKADRVQTFESSFHGLAGKGGDVHVADCASCHGWHDVLPSSDEKSRIHPAQLAATCGQCHPGAGQRWAGGGVKAHATLAHGGDGSRAARWVWLFYVVLAIPLTGLGLFVHNGLDLARKAREPRARRRRGGEAHFSPSERWQHGAAAGSFLLLAWTGFCLQFPGAWWAAPLKVFGGESVRPLAHRAAAGLFLLAGALHLAWLATARGRVRLREFLPAWRDLSDPLALLAYNAGRSPQRPVLPAVSYIEKFEYWALLWGSVVMTATGAVLIFHNAALAWLPLWIVECARVAHFLEAILACMAIALWHGYWVALDPDVYPMNWAWLTGSEEPPGRRES